MTRCMLSIDIRQACILKYDWQICLFMSARITQHTTAKTSISFPGCEKECKDRLAELEKLTAGLGRLQRCCSNSSNTLRCMSAEVIHSN